MFLIYILLSGKIITYCHRALQERDCSFFISGGLWLKLARHFFVDSCQKKKRGHRNKNLKKNMCTFVADTGEPLVRYENMPSNEMILKANFLF
jgi:hypothetical protein